MTEDLGEALEALDLAGRQRFSASQLPQRQQREGECLDRALAAALVDAHLTQVEQHAIVEAALVDVAADLRLVDVEIALDRALGIEHEAMGHQVNGREVRLAAQAAQLLEVAVRWEAEEPLQQLPEQRLSQRLLVFGRRSAAQIVGDIRGSVQCLVGAGTGIERRPQALHQIALMSGQTHRGCCALLSRSDGPAVRGGA